MSQLAEPFAVIVVNVSAVLRPLQAKEMLGCLRRS